MKAGRTSQIRVNPRDCMAVVDVVQQIGLAVRGISFAQVVSIALSSLLEAARQSGTIPVRDGFEYEAMMQPFAEDRKVDRGRKLQITKSIRDVGPDILIPAVHAASQGVSGAAGGSREERKRRNRYEELRPKFEFASESMTAEEIQEYADLRVDFM